MQALPLVKRGPGRPPGSKSKKRLALAAAAAAAAAGAAGRQPKRKMVGTVRRWTRKLVSDGHLDVVKWVVVEGSERNRRFVEDEEAAAAAAAAAAAESDSEENETIARRTRVQRVKSMAELEAMGGFYQQGLAAQPAAPQPQVNLVRYRCPLAGCGQVFFKVRRVLLQAPCG